MLVDREKERNRFVENKFFAIEATLYEEKDKQEFKAKLVSYDEKSLPLMKILESLIAV